MKKTQEAKIDTKSDVWTAHEVADYLKMCSKTVYTLAHAGKIPCTKIGTICRFSRKKIESLM